MVKILKTLAERAAHVKVIQKEIDWCENASVGQTEGGELEAVNAALVADREKEITKIENQR